MAQPAPAAGVVFSFGVTLERPGGVGLVLRSSPHPVSRSRRIVGALACAVLSLAAPVAADPPPGYYTAVDVSNAAVLRSTLHAVIDDHTRYPYSSAGTDTWNILELADQDPANASNILDVYRNRSLVKFGGGTGPYNREHTWPNSYGFPDDGGSNYPYTDCHHLFLSDVGYNNDRGNLPFGNTAGGTERVTDVNGGQGGGAGSYPGNSNWYSGGAWQTWVGRKGDVARAILYMDIRYEGGTHGVSGAAEPNLIVTDNLALIVATGSNASVAYMGILSVLVQWHAQDPVDARERARNDVVYGFQGNRNPFIDHPEWVNGLFVSSTGPTIASISDVPADQGGYLEVDWQRNSLDVAGSVAPIAQYTVQRLQSTTWIDVGSTPATQSASYSLVVATPDIATPSNPQPGSQYRVTAIETAGTVRPSSATSAYSVDNLAPPAPVVTLDTSGTPWVLSWTAPAIPDFAQACVYRGDAPGFEPQTPLACVPGTNYLEFDTQAHWYVVQFSDTHGNLGEFSLEVGSTPTDAPAWPVARTAITGIHPNPMNPAALVLFQIARPGPVRIDVFAADGRRVRALLAAQRGAGKFEVRWDGTDDAGVPASAGSYFVRLESTGAVDTRKIVMVK